MDMGLGLRSARVMFEEGHDQVARFDRSDLPSVSIRAVARWRSAQAIVFWTARILASSSLVSPPT